MYISERKAKVAKILGNCGFSKIEEIVDAFFTCLDDICEKSQVNWIDADLFDQDLENEILVKIYNKMMSIKIQIDNSEIVKSEEIYLLLSKTFKVNIAENLNFNANQTSIIFSLAHLLSDCCFEDNSLSIKNSDEKKIIEFKTDMGFGFGLNDILCGYEEHTVSRNSWLLNIVARTIEGEGKINLEKSVFEVNGFIVFE